MLSSLVAIIIQSAWHVASQASMRMSRISQRIHCHCQRPAAATDSIIIIGWHSWLVGHTCLCDLIYLVDSPLVMGSCGIFQSTEIVKYLRSAIKDNADRVSSANPPQILFALSVDLSGVCLSATQGA